MLELSEIIEKDGEAETGRITDRTIAGRKPDAAEVAAERVVQKLLLNSNDLGAPVVLACLHVDSCVLKCLATNFGAVRAASFSSVPLAYCVPPLAETSLTPVSAAALDGTLAVVRRGAVPVSVKAQHVQDAGAVGLVLINSDDHAWLPFVKTEEEQTAASKTHIPIVIVPKSAEAVLGAGGLATLLIQTSAPGPQPNKPEHGDTHRESTPASSFDPVVPSGQIEPLSECGASTIQNGDRLSPSSEQPNTQRLGQPNQVMWPTWADAASTAAVLQSSVVALEDHCQRLSTRVQVLEDDNCSLRKEVAQQQKQHGHERESLAAEVAQWMTTSSRAAEQLETVTCALEEATATAAAAVSEPQKRVQILEDDNCRLREHIAQQQQQHKQERDGLVAEVAHWMEASIRAAEQLETANRSLGQATATATTAVSEHEQRQLIMCVEPAPEHENMPTTEPPEAVIEATSNAERLLLARKPAVQYDQSSVEHGQKTTATVKTARKPRTMSASQEQAVCQHACPGSSGLDHDTSIAANESTVAANDELASAMSRSDIGSSGADAYSLPPDAPEGMLQEPMSETAHVDDHDHHAEEELAGVAAQVQALEEFQARAMAGLQRLHEMKSEEGSDAVERDAPEGMLQEPVSETAHVDDDDHHAEEQLAAVAAQVQALEEFQARAMAGLQRLHEMKSEEGSD
eukprot:COSAG02_NODE_8252_length_2641_cov_2.861133_1_plen_686_part_01